MKPGRFTFLLASFIFILSSFPIQRYATEGSFPVQPAVVQDDCGALIDQLLADDDWFSKLINPTYTTVDQVAEQLAFYGRVYWCLDDDLQYLSEEWRITGMLLEYFMVFTGGYQIPSGGSRLVLVDLTTSDDPAIEEIRDQAGVPPPEGFVYVRFFSSRRMMPGLVSQAFDTNEVAGVTILDRYVAVLEEDQATWPEELLQNQTLPDTISHELIHAYVSSLLGSAGDDLPTWYHEGLAIYFSGSGEDHVVVTPSLTVSQTSPEDYQQYHLNFQFLEAKLGRKRLLDLIRLSLEAAAPAVLLQDLGILNEQDLIARVAEWQQQRNLKRLGIGSAAAVLLVVGMFRLMPQVKCKGCGFGGRKKDFVDGACPNCGRQYYQKSRW